MDANKDGLRFSRLLTVAVYALFYRPVTCLILAGATIYLPNLVVSTFLPAPDRFFSMDFALWSLTITPLSSVAVIFHAWITLQALEGNEAKEALRRTFSRLPTLYPAGVLITLIWVAAAFALLIPAVVWGVLCMVAIPAAAFERVGVVRSIQRSFELTRGRRWLLWGYSLMIVLPLALCLFLIELAIAGGHADQIAATPPKGIFEALVVMVGAAFSAAAYSELVKTQARGGDVGG